MDKPKTYIHPTSIVDNGSSIGAGTKIWHFCHVMPKSKIGTNCILGQNVFIGSDVIIGNNVKIQNNVSVYTGVICQNDVFIGPSAVFTNVLNPRSTIERKAEFKQTIIKRGATIGANATVVCGTTIGSYAFIGAGAIVTKDIPDYALVVGNPAKKMGWMSEAGARLIFEKNEATCSITGQKYLLKGNSVIKK